MVDPLYSEVLAKQLLEVYEEMLHDPDEELDEHRNRVEEMGWMGRDLAMEILDVEYD